MSFPYFLTIWATCLSGPWSEHFCWFCPSPSLLLFPDPCQCLLLICWSLSNPFANFCWHQSSPGHPVPFWRGAGEGIGHCCKPGHGRGRHHWGLLGENSFLIFYFCSSLWELLYFGDADDSKNEHTWILLFIFLLQQYLSRFFFVPGHGGRELQWLNLCWLLCINKSALVMLNCWIDEPILTVDYVNLFYICKILLQITQLLSAAFDLYCLFFYSYCVAAWTPIWSCVAFLCMPHLVTSAMKRRTAGW